MIQRLKEWIYAIRVCKKYGIKWNPFRGLDNASFSVSWDTNQKLTVKKIHMSLFYPYFLQTFMHEVGHIVLYKQGKAIRLYLEGKKRINEDFDAIVFDGKCFLNTLTEESLASRFSRKALRGKVDTKELVESFNTYSAWGYSRLKRKSQFDAKLLMELTDRVEKCTRSILK